MTRMQALLEQRQAIEDAIYALQQYRLLFQYFNPAELESECEPGLDRSGRDRKQLTN